MVTPGMLFISWPTAVFLPRPHFLSLLRHPILTETRFSCSYLKNNMKQEIIACTPQIMLSLSSNYCLTFRKRSMDVLGQSLPIIPWCHPCFCPTVQLRPPCLWAPYSQQALHALPLYSNGHPVTASSSWLCPCFMTLPPTPPFLSGQPLHSPSEHSLGLFFKHWHCSRLYATFSYGTIFLGNLIHTYGFSYLYLEYSLLYICWNFRSELTVPCMCNNFVDVLEALSLQYSETLRLSSFP